MSELVVITGCTRGLGRALVDRFAEAGWTVAGCGRSAERIESLNSTLGTTHRFDAVDVVDHSAVSLWAASVINSHGAPKLLLNNAAVMNHPAPLWEFPPAEFASLMSINVNGTFHVLRQFIPAMIPQGGVIVNYSSGWGRSTSAKVAPYCASKWAIEGLTQALAQELPPGLGAVALNPGIIDTDMLRQCWSEEAGGFPNAEQWSHRAAKFLQQLTPRHNGQSLNIS